MINSATQQNQNEIDERHLIEKCTPVHASPYAPVCVLQIRLCIAIIDIVSFPNFSHILCLHDESYKL